MIVAAALGIWVSGLQSDRFPDVPDDRWAYAVARKMLRENLEAGFPNLPTLMTGRPSYRLSTLIGAALSRPIQARQKWTEDLLAFSRTANPAEASRLRHSLRVSRRTMIVAAENRKELERLIDVFPRELQALGWDIQALRHDFRAAIRGAFQREIPVRNGDR